MIKILRGHFHYVALILFIYPNSVHFKWTVFLHTKRMAESSYFSSYWQFCSWHFCCWCSLKRENLSVLFPQQLLEFSLYKADSNGFVIHYKMQSIHVNVLIRASSFFYHIYYYSNVEIPNRNSISCSNSSLLECLPAMQRPKFDSRPRHDCLAML
jgi:hypothetical protein